MLEVLQTEIFQKWRTRLRDERARALIASRLSRLSDGHFGDSKLLGDGIIELRIDSGPGYRIYCHRRGITIIVLLCGGDKDSQRKDITAAKKLAKKWSE